MGKKQILVRFDEQSLSNLEEMAKQWNFSSPVEAMRESFAISTGLQNQAKEGFIEVIVRNPRTGEERRMVR